MEQNKNVGISFGVLAPKLSMQLKKQKFKFDEKKVAIFQKEMDCVNQLRFHSNLLTDSMVDKCFQKLHKAIVAHVAKENGMKVVNKNQKEKP